MLPPLRRKGGSGGAAVRRDTLDRVRRFSPGLLLALLVACSDDERLARMADRHLPAASAGRRFITPKFHEVSATKRRDGGAGFVLETRRR